MRADSVVEISQGGCLCGRIDGYLNLDVAKFEDCLKTNKYKEHVEKSVALAQKLGIRGVPGFILASTNPGNPAKAKGISVITGAQPLANFQKEIDQAIASLLPSKA